MLKRNSVWGSGVVLLLTNLVMAANASTYSFGGSCPSQGAWTQAALLETQNIVSVIRRLQHDEACTGIVQLAENLESAQTMLSLSKDERAESLVESLPSEISALRTTLMNPNGPKDVVRELLFKKTLEAASIGGAAAATSVTPVMSSAAAVEALYKRTARATKYGLNALQQTFNRLPSYKECLVGHPDEGMLLLSSAVKLGAAFASSDGGAAQQLGNALAGLTSMMRENRFSRAVRKGRETEFWFSVSCLMESVTKNYCEAQSAQDLLAYAQKEYRRSMGDAPVGAIDPNSDNPLEGYYLLVREIPMVAQWLRTVKQGSDPRRPADAKAQNEDNNSIQQMRELHKNLQATMFQEMEVMRSQPTDYGKKNKLFNIISSLVRSLTSQRLTVGGAAEFFANQINEDLLPFYLIGMDTVPAACLPKEGSALVPANCWSNWMSNGGKYQSYFDDPIALAATVEERVRKLIEGANENAAIFFRQRLVIDLLNLTNLTLVGPNMSVRQALQHMDRFLERFEKRLTDSYADSIMRPSVYDTRIRIARILKSYEDLARVGASLKGKGLDAYDTETLERTREGAKKIIDTVFAEVDILYQNDVFLTNRFSTFIQRDFAIRIQQGESMTPYQEQLMKITQDQLVTRLTLTFGTNPTVARNDLSGAYFVNSSNLGLLEEVFSDSIYVMLEELNEVVRGRPATSEALKQLADDRYKRDLRERKIGAYYSAASAVTKNKKYQAYGTIAALMTKNPLLELIAWAHARFSLKANSPDLYYRDNNPNRVPLVESKFGDIAQLRGRLCGQTLAFANRERFIPLCKGAVMKSAFSGEDELSPLDLVYDQYLDASSAQAIRRDPVKYHERVCALNDYSIRNWVRMLEDRDRTADSFTEETYDLPVRSSVLPELSKDEEES